MRSAGHAFARLRTVFAAAAAVVVAVALAVAVALTRAQTARPRPVLAAAGSTKITTPFPGFVLTRGRFTTIDFPGGALSQAIPFVINDFGTMVGDYDDADGVHHGFVRSRSGKYTSIDFPGARGSTLSAINNRGQMAGRYSLVSPYPGDPAGNSQQRSFLLDKGKYTKIDFPGAIETQALSINNLGQVVGQYTRQDGTFGGFRWDKGRIKDIDIPDVPGQIGASVSAINDKGELVGSVAVTENSQLVQFGFLLARGRFTTFRAPRVPFTVPFGINNRGQISGTTLADGTLSTARGFLLAKGAKGPFTTIRFPGTAASVAFGLNNLTQVVGGYPNPAVNPPDGMQPTNLMPGMTRR
jgi:uncharacterized membrane protein